MKRIDHLNKHLDMLVSTNKDGQYNDLIAETLIEIRKDLGIGVPRNLESYSTCELHEELLKRQGVKEVRADLQEEVAVTLYKGEAEDKKFSVSGPVRILINQD